MLRGFQRGERLFFVQIECRIFRIAGAFVSFGDFLLALNKEF